MDPQQDYRNKELEKSEPEIRPNLGVIEGGGEGDGRPAGDLSLAPNLDEDDSAESGGFQSIDGGGEQTPRKTGHLRAAPESADSLEDRESSGASSNPTAAQQSESARLGLGYTGTGDKKINFNGPSVAKGSRRWLLIGGAGAALGVLAMFFVLFIVLSSLKLPNLMANITAFEFARLSRQVAQHSQQITDEALGTEAAAAEAGKSPMFQAWKDRYANVKSAASDKYYSIRSNTWGRFDSYRPDMIIKNLGQENGLKFTYATGADGRVALSRVSLNGVDYDISPIKLTGADRFKPGLRWWVRLNQQAAFEKEFVPALKEAMIDKSGGVIFRSTATSSILRQLGISRGGWLVNTFDKLTGNDARAADTTERYTRAQAASTTPAESAVSEINNIANDTKQAETDTINNPTALKQAVTTEAGVPSKVAQTITNGAKALTETTVGNAAISIADPLYSIGLPLCIIYDGSMQNSGGVIDNQMGQQQAVYYDLAAKGAQQKRGVLPGENPTGFANAIAGTNASLGDNLQNSNAMIRASNGTVDTSSSQSAEANAMGTYSYSIVDALASYSPVDISILAHIQNFISKPTCAIITSPGGIAGGIAANIASIIVNLPDGEAGEIALETSAQGVATGVRAMASSFSKYLGEQLAAKIAQNLGKDAIKKGIQTEIDASQTPRLLNVILQQPGVSSKIAGKFVLKQGGILAGIEGLTLVADYITTNRANIANSGMAQNNNLADEADSGANIAAGELARRQYYSRAMLKTEVVASDKADTSYVASIDSTQNAYTRYIALSNPRSLVSRFAYAGMNYVKPGLVVNLVQMFGNLLNPLHYFGSMANSLNPTAHAITAANTHYGNVQFGWSESELALISSNASYGSMLENERVLSQSGKLDEISANYDKCFSDSLGTLLANKDIVRDENGDIVDDSGATCSPVNLGPNNQKDHLGDLVFRYRIMNDKSNILSQLEGLQAGPQASTDSTGSSSTAAAATSGAAFGADGFPGGSCVQYIKYILSRHLTVAYKDTAYGDGKDVAGNIGRLYGVTVDHTPAVHSIVSFPAGPPYTSQSAGHVAIVDTINSDGSLVVEEANWSNTNAYGTHTVKASLVSGLTFAHIEGELQ